ncbi:hypothetical protein K7432_006345 [Basidiobolus ranarum]|uniref:Uncharacterized protein n=1 Tax=Basidiobolus ranarum TaxID=34480 RepID=A0ABR2W1W9_9FUNG
MAKRKQRVQKVEVVPTKDIEEPTEEIEEETEAVNSELENDQVVEPPKKKGKKGKKFADQSTMFSLIDQIAAIQDEKIDKKLKKEAEVRSHIQQREREMDTKQKLKKEKLASSVFGSFLVGQHLIFCYRSR